MRLPVEGTSADVIKGEATIALSSANDDGGRTVDFSGERTGGSVNLSTGLATFGGETETIGSARNVIGSAFDDEIIGSFRVNALDGGDGDDTMHSGRGSDTLLGGRGDDNIHGGDGDDLIYGGKGHDFAIGDLGNDSVRGGFGHDTLYGAEGNDSLEGGKGDDVLYGGDGGDFLFGGSGRNFADGGAGSDVFIFGPNSRDFVTTGEGADFVYLADQKSKVVVYDFELGVDSVALDVAKNSPSIDELVASGRLEITSSGGDALIKFGPSTLLLKGVDPADFSYDDLSLV